MKRTNLYGVLICTAALLINTCCNVETLPIDHSTSTPPPTHTVPPKTETPANAPTAFASEDLQVILPVNVVWLSGAYSDIGTIDNFVWKKTSGPSSYIIENSNSLRTKVSKLEKGIYEFELTVTNKSGLTDKDTTRVTVGQMSANLAEIIFNNMSWTCPWYCQVEIENIYSHLPSGSVFRIYIQRDNSTNWEEVVHQKLGEDTHAYSYILNNGNLIIYQWNDPDPRDTPNIKIVY